VPGDSKVTIAMTANLPRRRALLVEDELLIAMIAVENLAEIGYDVTEASSAKAALAQLADAKPDLAVVDLGLPDGPGEVLISEIRARCPGLPIVVTSGHSEATLRNRVALSEDIAYVEKPYTLAALKAAIDSLVAQD
jgi:DNA-binding response OmpR family regulator